MYPLIAPEHLRWVEQSVDGLLSDLRTLTVQLRDLAALEGLPPALQGDELGATEHLRAQAQFVAWECALLRGHLVRLREAGRLDDEGAGRLEPGPRLS